MAKKAAHQYTEKSIKSLDWKQHIRLRPGMYIGKLGDGSNKDDGIYVLLKETIDNCIDEFTMGFGKRIEIKIENGAVSVRDYGRGIPLGKLVDCVSRINTGGKYDSAAFQKSVGLNGIGTKAVNALSTNFYVQSFREGKTAFADFVRGTLKKQKKGSSKESEGTLVTFTPDDSLFRNYKYDPEYVERMLQHYAFLNVGLTISFNGKDFRSENGLTDLLQSHLTEAPLYPIIHLKDKDIEVAFTHTTSYGEDYYSFVNGQHTTQGGTHLAAFREGIVKTARDFFGKNYDPSDVRESIEAAISIRIQEPVFESQTKTKLGSLNTGPGGPTLRNWVNDFMKKELDNYLHKHPKMAEIWKKKIEQSEKERKEIAGIKKLANERARKANLHNKKLRDCKVHYNSRHARRMESTLFITEGDSASGSITTARDVKTQAVFSLRGKPLNSFGLTKKVVYENEEFNLLVNALNIEAGVEELRYNRVVISTDADVDGMHIRLLLLTFFLQFFPEMVKAGHVYVLQTPLFRVRNKKETIYCYSEEEKAAASRKLGAKPEITRFKGLGEISPGEFKMFIGEDMRLEPVSTDGETSVHDLLAYYMGKNSPERQDFIINNLKLDDDLEPEPEEEIYA